MLAQRLSLNEIENAGLAWERAMRQGDFPAAWAISDAVLARPRAARPDDPALPYHERYVWDGRRLEGRRVLVRCYHGLGDTLQYSRFLPALRARAAHVTLEVQAELAPLLAHLADEVHPFDPARPLPPAEADVEIMELSHALRRAPEAAPYLHAAPSGPGGIGPGGIGPGGIGPGGIGLCWQAGGWDLARSIPAQALHGLAPPGRAISLQRGPGAAAAAALGAIDPLGGSMDLVAMARLIAGLDAVVTVDTMIAHLAGALGRPTVVLLKHAADWRWGTGPRWAWYSSVRLARQDRPGDWSGVVAAAGNFLFRPR